MICDYLPDMGYTTWTEAAVKPQKRTIAYKEVFRVQGNMEAIRLIDSRYYRKNSEWIKTKAKAYYQENKEAIKAKAREKYRLKKLKQILTESV